MFGEGSGCNPGPSFRFRGLGKGSAAGRGVRGGIVRPAAVRAGRGCANGDGDVRYVRHQTERVVRTSQGRALSGPQQFACRIQIRTNAMARNACCSFDCNHAQSGNTAPALPCSDGSFANLRASNLLQPAGQISGAAKKRLELLGGEAFGHARTLHSAKSVRQAPLCKYSKDPLRLAGEVRQWQSANGRTR